MMFATAVAITMVAEISVNLSDLLLQAANLSNRRQQNTTVFKYNIAIKEIYLI